MELRTHPTQQEVTPTYTTSYPPQRTPLVPPVGNQTASNVNILHSKRRRKRNNKTCFEHDRCERLNHNCLNEAGNSVADIARATGQEFLLRGRWGGANLDPTSAPPQQQYPAEYEEARPAWEQQRAPTAPVAAAAGGGVQYASVVAEGGIKACFGVRCLISSGSIFVCSELEGKSASGARWWRWRLHWW